MGEPLGDQGCVEFAVLAEGTLANHEVAVFNLAGVNVVYVHPSENAVLDAIARLGGHKIGPPVLALPSASGDSQVTH